MSLLMQALRKAERARALHGHEDEHEDEHEPPQFGAESLPSPPLEGGPAFAVMPEAWHLEPLAADAPDAEPPVVAAQEALHDPVPPQARHEAVRPKAAPAIGPDDTRRAASLGESARGMRGAGLRPQVPRAIVSPQRRLVVLAGALAALLAAFAFIYWRAVAGPGPGARLPMVPMPAPGALAAAQAGGQPSEAIPVTPYVTASSSEPAAPATAPAAPLANVQAAAPAPAAMAAAAPATQPRSEVTVPTPEQLAAIPDPAIRAEAMRDAAERAARQVRTETGPPPVSPRISRQQPVESAVPPAVAAVKPRQTSSPRQAAVAGAPEIKTAVGENGDVQFVRGAAAPQVAPAVQHGYDALQSGDLATARQQYGSALLQDPNNRDALLGAAAVALRERDGRQASNDYLRLLELDPNDPEALAGLAELLPGDLQANEIKLRGLARQHPESGPVQSALGNLLARQGRWPEAQQSYFRAFNAMPENADYAFNLGVGLDRMNQPRLAQTYYRRALELARTSAPGFDINAVRKRLQALETPPQ